jgi:hypothetical protein
MTKHLVAIALSPEIIGVAGTDLHFGQYALRNTPGTRVPGTSSHPGAFLSELRDFVKRVIQSRKYQYIAMSSSEYGINTKNFFDAEAKAKMIGTVLLTAFESNCKVVEVTPRNVSQEAIGRKGANPEDYLKAAYSNGTPIKGMLAAEAFWIMVLASKE